MNAPARTFEIKDAIRQQVPVLIGLSGASGSGKTYSAMLLAEVVVVIATLPGAMPSR